MTTGEEQHLLETKRGSIKEDLGKIDNFGSIQPKEDFFPKTWQWISSAFVVLWINQGDSQTNQKKGLTNLLK